MEAPLTITIASGKGGTGKTLVATSLALSLPEGVQYLDCDVEAPNAHIFLNPRWEQEIPTGLVVPRVDETVCTACGECNRVCEFKAIVVIVDKVLVFDELCHGCGACTYICPVDAITEIEKPIGVIRKGSAMNGIHFLQGLLNIGEPMATPIIRKLKKEADPSAKITLRDAPPGTSCPVIESVEGSDFTILVTEPTPFGLNDLKLAVGVGRELNVPMGVIINRADAGDDRVHRYCEAENLPILLEIPLKREIARGYADGRTLIQILPEYRDRFLEVYEKIEREVRHV